MSFSWSPHQSELKHLVGQLPELRRAHSPGSSIFNSWSRAVTLLLLLLAFLPQHARAQTTPQRVVILKVDGLGADLLYDAMRETDPATGKSRLPWFAHIFGENGTVFQNFYTRGISLSAPSWSILDTGRHTIIRGNVEYDRYTGQVYDYLNFFPFYLGYARSREVDMPAVQVLDRAGIPLLIDYFRYPQIYQSFQLFQRGVRWTTLKNVLAHRFSSKVLFSMLEGIESPSLDADLQKQLETELEANLMRPEILYLDLFVGSVDHIGHETNDPAALFDVLHRLDALVGRIWSKVQQSPLADATLLVVVSDHGMNNTPGVISQTFSLTDLFNSRDGGAHHVITNRVQLSDYKLKGLNPLVHRVITPSTVSFYLKGEASRYPTAWLDIDGNERAAVHLRNSDLNKIHILLLQLARTDLPGNVRSAAIALLQDTIDRHRAAWGETASQLAEEMSALEQAIDGRKLALARENRKWSADQRAEGEDKAARRRDAELRQWEEEYTAYTGYTEHLRALLALQPDPVQPLSQKISTLIPQMSLGDNNTVGNLEHYVVGLGPLGLLLDSKGRIDEQESFRYVNYFSLLEKQRVRNNPQAALTDHPIDFTMMRLPDQLNAHAYWLCRSDDNQLLVLTSRSGAITLRPIRRLHQDDAGKIAWQDQPWRAGLPLELFEDPHLHLPPGVDRAQWLSGWHTEREWLDAIHETRYSNGVIGVIEELSPVADNVPGPPGINAILLRYEKRRRELVQADFHVFASDHWNFNTRFPNPGGNHGSFLRISTHSVWMMAGAGIPKEQIDRPYDSLNFASTILSLLGKAPPLPDRVVNLDHRDVSP